MSNSEINIVLFDGVCNLCNKTVRFIIRRDPKAKFRFASVQSESGQLLLRQLSLPIDRYDSIVYICDDKFYLKSTAVLTILVGNCCHFLKYFHCFYAIRFTTSLQSGDISGLDILKVVLFRLRKILIDSSNKNLFWYKSSM